MAAGDIVIQGVNALENSDLIFAQLQGESQRIVAHLAGKLEFGDDDLFPLGQSGEVLAEQFHVQTQGRFIVNISVGSAGGSFAVESFKIAVHSHCVGIYSPTLQFFCDFHSCGGFARTGRAGQQDDGTLVQVGEDLISGQGDPLGVVFIALSQKLRDITFDPFVDLL